MMVHRSTARWCHQHRHFYALFHSFYFYPMKLQLESFLPNENVSACCCGSASASSAVSACASFCFFCFLCFFLLPLATLLCSDSLATDAGRGRGRGRGTGRGRGSCCCDMDGKQVKVILPVACLRLPSIGIVVASVLVLALVMIQGLTVSPRHCRCR
jgi:hypothetical protein